MSSCPTSDELLSLSLSHYQERDRSSDLIAEHAEACDFCSMELQLYRKFPQSEEVVEAPIIPRALFQLAKSMLSRKSSGDLGMNRFFGDEGELELNQPCGAF